MAPSERHELLIIEKQYGGTQHLWKLTDEGEVVAANASPGVSRQHKANSGLKQLLASAFLPVGYPHSVTPDYAGFVMWNSVQAISSYVRGVLSSHAVFKGVGVGSQAATALGAVFQFFIRDILGMAGGIVFAYAAGGNFDSNAKQWRLFADVMNNVAMALDLASPLLPGSCFMVLVSLASVARAMVGMASGATHAALTQHFAAAGSNAADISAKAESRERATSIIGSLLGMLFTHHMADHVSAAWVFFAALTWVHVWANLRAMRCLVLSSLNEPRLKLLLHHYQDKDKILTPKQVSGLENLAIPPLATLLEPLTGKQYCRVLFGTQLTAAISRAAAAAGCTSSCQLLWQTLTQQKPAADRQYMVLVTGQRRKVVEVVLHAGADQHLQLHAYLHAQHLAAQLHHNKGSAEHDCSADEMLERSQEWIDKQLPWFLAALKQHGWELDKLYLQRPRWTADW